MNVATTAFSVIRTRKILFGFFFDRREMSRLFFPQLHLENELRRPHQIIRPAADDQILVSPAQSAEPQQVKYLKG